MSNPGVIQLSRTILGTMKDDAEIPLNSGYAESERLHRRKLTSK
jgi:hypothetical protein